MSETFAQRLHGIVGEAAVRAEEPLAAHTTFAIGGPAEWFVSPATDEQARDAAALCREADVSLRVLGAGSNLLVADAGVRGVVMHLGDRFAAIEVREGGEIYAQAGATNAAVAEAACTAGLAGYEFACGIPGSIGGAAVMNAGAYDGEFKGAAISTRCLTPEGDIVEVPAEQAEWSYRHSMMADRGYIVLGATLRLTPDAPEAIRARMDDLTRRREEKQPLEMPSAGSTFKRPEGYFAGKLIQDAGLRGFRMGGAQVSEKHTGFVVNAGGATAADVKALIAEVQRRVLDCEGVQLEPEVRMWE